MTKKTAKDLWQVYRFLTREMIKFLTKQDMNLFYDLLNQRQKIQDMIEQASDDGFRTSPEGRILLSEIQRDSQVVEDKLQLRMGTSKRRHQVTQAYSSVSTTAVNQMNRKR